MLLTEYAIWRRMFCFSESSTQRRCSSYTRRQSASRQRTEVQCMYCVSLALCVIILCLCRADIQVGHVSMLHWREWLSCCCCPRHCRTALSESQSSTRESSHQTTKNSYREEGLGTSKEVLYSHPIKPLLLFYYCLLLLAVQRLLRVRANVEKLVEYTPHC